MRPSSFVRVRCALKGPDRTGGRLSAPSKFRQISRQFVAAWLNDSEHPGRDGIDAAADAGGRITGQPVALLDMGIESRFRLGTPNSSIRPNLPPGPGHAQTGRPVGPDSSAGSMVGDLIFA